MFCMCVCACVSGPTRLGGDVEDHVEDVRHGLADQACANRHKKATIHELYNIVDILDTRRNTCDSPITPARKNNGG